MGGGGGGQVIIWVQLTQDQRMYYKAIYEQKIAVLLKGASHKNMPNLRNLVRTGAGSPVAIPPIT